MKRVVLALLAVCPLATAAAAEIPVPSVLDDRLDLSLFAAEPTIVTPIGIAVDRRHRIFVIESHTHHTPRGYPGPKHDRVKMFVAHAGAKRPDRVSVFADGFHHAMNLSFAPDGQLYLVHRNGVVILHDRDDDGVSEARTSVLALKTAGVYPHDGLGGIVFSADGWLYIGMGENLGVEYTLVGSDGSTYSGGGEGGNIFRCRPDGSDLHYVATGFWNPFALEFDHAGRLLAVDNDPDARPPCRLLHIVDQGDYGYKFRYGRRGLHPYVCWNGELPGTLPMVAGTGEAPSGILLTDKTNLPAEYRGQLLVTSWGDHTLELYKPRPAGASIRADREILARGGETFRPVGIAAAPDGTIYITDWALKDYPVHQNGRIWRLAAKSGQKVIATSPPPTPDVAVERMNRLLASSAPTDYPALRDAVADSDPFIRSAAISALAKPVYRDNILRDTTHEKPDVRLGMLLALRRARHDDSASILRAHLADADPRVRLMALIWIGEDRLTALSRDVDAALTAGPITPELFHAYLATSRTLADAAKGLAHAGLPRRAGPGTSGTDLIRQILRDASKPTSLRALAAAMLNDPDDDATVDLLVKLALRGDPELRVEAVRTLANATHARATPLLKRVAHEMTNPADLRAEAILALSARPAEVLTTLIPLLDDSAQAVRIETARVLRRVVTNAPIRAALQRKFDAPRSTPHDAALFDQLRLALDPADANSSSLPTRRPDSDDTWRAALRKPGRAASGRRVFFNPTAQCATCHTVRGRGGQVGPDLSTIARSSDRDKLIDSILNPSREVAPQYVNHIVHTTDGVIISGLLIGDQLDDSVTITTTDARTITIPADRVSLLRPGTLSVMPDALETSLTVQDFRDLIAYLVTLK